MECMEQEGSYSRDAFNEYGDIEWEDHGLETEFSEFSVLVPKISDSVAKRLNDLNTYFENRGGNPVDCRISDRKWGIYSGCAGIC